MGRKTAVCLSASVLLNVVLLYTTVETNNLRALESAADSHQYAALNSERIRIDTENGKLEAKLRSITWAAKHLLATIEDQPSEGAAPIDTPLP